MEASEKQCCCGCKCQPAQLPVWPIYIDPRWYPTPNPWPYQVWCGSASATNGTLFNG